ncbi:MAG: VanZ family protein [Candidatus Limnocylindrales bacterium]
MDDLLKAVPRFGLTLFERGAAAVVVVWAVIALARWRRSGWRSSLALSAPEALVAIGVVGVWAFTVAPDRIFLPGDIPQHMPINIVPILPLVSGLTDPRQGWWLNGPNLVANLVLYMPIGLGLRWRFGLRVWQILLIAAAVSAAVEVSQALSDQLRSPDINDVILNCVSAVAGAWAFLAVSRILGPRRQGRREVQPEPIS